MIKHVNIRNYKCLKDFEIDLGPLTVLIGPNDSGKTSFLKAMQTWSGIELKGGIPNVTLDPELGPEATCHANTGTRWKESDIWRHKESQAWVTLEMEAGSKIGLLNVPDVRFPQKVLFSADGNLSVDEAIRVAKKVGRVELYHLVPDELRKLTTLTQTPMSSVGLGLPTLLMAILTKNRRGFFKMEEEFYRIFPHYKHIDVENNRAGQPSFYMQFLTTGGTKLGAESVSDGVMLTLAYLAMAYRTDSPKLLMIEEPEAGVHHGNMKEILTVLKRITDTTDTQVILTTHSPDLLGLVEPEDVRVFQKDKEGAVTAKALSKFDQVEELRKDFTTGEIWTFLSGTEGI